MPMKPFMIAMLAIGSGLFVAALLWPDRPQPPAQQQRRFTSNSGTPRPMSPLPETRATPAPAVPVPSSIYEPTSPLPISYKPAAELTSEQSAGADLADEQGTLKETGTDNT